MSKALYCLCAAAMVAAGLLLLPGCGRRAPLYRIGVSQCSDDEWRTQMNGEIRREMLFHEDTEVEIRTSDDDNARQIEDIRYFSDNGFDLIIVSPREAPAITPAVRDAYRKGIPVIVFDRALEDSSYTSYMKLDNRGIGRAAAQYAVSMLAPFPGAQVLELRGLEGSSPAAERHRGFVEVMDSARSITLVSSVPSQWKKEKARTAADSLLRIYPQVRLVYAHNDEMALGAAEAVRAAGRSDVKIIGTDGAPSLGMRAVEDSLIDATFIYPTEGARVIRTAMDILKGKPYKRIDSVPANRVVDISNARTLLEQEALLAERTRQIEVLNERNLLMQSHNKVRNWLLYSVCSAVFLLLAAILFMVRSLRQKRNYEKILTQKNIQLSGERDRQEELYARLEEATRSKLMFFTNVSHDLRTPLTLIAEPVEQVAAATYLTAPHRSLMNIAVRNIKILRRMIEQILDFRNYQNGRTELSLQEACPARLVQEWSDAFRAIAAKRRIKFTVTAEISDPCSMAVDVEKLERIFFNLVSNAFKFTPDRGSISVECISGETELTLRVSDTGIGIPAGECTNIFDRFYRVDKVHPTGSGIGLSLTKAFVEVMGGTVSVNSEEGKGSVFTVVIPVTHMEEEKSGALVPVQPSRELEEEVKAGLEKETSDPRSMESSLPLLLAVDDNADVTAMMQDILSDKYNVITAPDGATAVRLAKKYVPDIIVADVMMPGMDGYGLTQRIKDEISTSHIPVLLLTACRLDEQRMQGYRAGADAYISKPFVAEMLLSQIESLLRNRRRVHNLYTAVAAVPPARRPLPETSDPKAMESDFYRQFLRIVNESYADSELSLKDIASKLGIGPTQLARKIKALTSCAPLDIIRNVRLRAARNLILTTEFSISEIAYEVGFSSPQYFAKCFRETFGKTPTELRTGY